MKKLLSFPDDVEPVTRLHARLEHTFSTLSSPALKCSSLAQNALIAPARSESVRLQHDQRVRLLFGRWFRKPWNETENRGKCSCKTSFQLRMGLKREETRQRWKNSRRLSYICCVFWKISGSLLAFFHLCLVSAHFLENPYLKMKLHRIAFTW